MLDRLKQIPKRIAEIWKKYSAKQRAVIISTVAVVVLALIILIVILNQTKFVKLYTFEDTATAKRIGATPSAPFLPMNIQC